MNAENLIHQITFRFENRIFKIPDYMVDGLVDYIQKGFVPDSFLRCVLENDLIGAVKNADLQNIANLPAYVNFLYNYAPPACYGSVENVKGWLEKNKRANNVLS